MSATVNDLCYGDRVLVSSSCFRGELAAHARMRYVTHDGRAHRGVVTVTSHPYQVRDEQDLPSDTIELVDRGNRWRYERNLPLLPFDNYADELSFWRGLGKATEANCPASGYFVWTVTEALFALKLGFIDVVVMSHGSLGLLSEPSLHAYRLSGDIPGGTRRLSIACYRDLLKLV